ncbi:zf-TFIIB domain-containing protein [Hydrogenophaga sp.]|uniref:zf-TFIIB domain-containing protein n=1 Tax=Hydrogenophaga sp. TaxID=1904254 RepID=UPI00344DCDD8
MPELRRAAATWPRARLGCPVCHRAMPSAAHEGIEIELCHHCTGSTPCKSAAWRSRQLS